MKKYDGIVFDLDGTLIDSLGDIVLGCNQCLEKWGLPKRSEEEVIAAIGHGPRHLCQGVSGLSGEKLDRFLEDYITWGKVNQDPTAHAFDGVTEALDRLDKAGIHLGVYTNRAHDWGKRLVDKFFKPSLLSPVTGMQSDGLRKPDPFGLLLAAKQWSTKPERLVMMGDSPVDIETGHAVGATSIAVSWGYSSREALVAAKPTVLVDSIDEFMSFVGF